MPRSPPCSTVPAACNSKLARGPQLEQQRPPLSPRREKDFTGLDLFVTAVVQREAFDSNAGVAPHAARRMVALARTSATPMAAASTPNTLRDRVAGEATGWPVPQRLRSTLSAPLQRFAVQALGRQLRELKGRRVEDGTIVVLERGAGLGRLVR